MTHFREGLDILVVAAHPDDAELGCGGTILLAVESGLQVGIVDLTQGEMSTRGTLTTREQETTEATRLLGVKQRHNLGLPDTQIGHSLAHRDALINLLREVRPRIVLAPWWQDRHPDHARTGELTREAVFFAGVKKLSTTPPFRPSAIYHYMLHHPFDPTFIVDISTVWERKQAVLSTYGSQFKPTDTNEPSTSISDGTFMSAIEARSRWYGSMIGATYGESFLSIGPLGIRDISGFLNNVVPDDPSNSYQVY